HIHNMGYVHHDIKPDNILFVDGEAKIADFGVAMRAAEESTKGYIRGTPFDELSEIPVEMSEEGKNFFCCCFQKDPTNRWTVEILLTHPFITSSYSELKSEAEVIVCSVLDPTRRSVLSYSFAKTLIPPTPPKPLKPLNSFLIFEAVREMIMELAIKNRPD
ncbi:serine/threonine-protein kinase pakH-like, partial [Phalaenopsis equestris]|uniref:serine/threonine-protein kinase pakH-like n=1 Tax=Phalaenopsis equestris TaxID=78828 RepID=UPI0009E2D914